MENFNNLVKQKVHVCNCGAGTKQSKLSLSLILLFFITFYAYPQPTIGAQKNTASLADETSQTQESETKKVVIVDRPDNPELHKYLDSLNLYKAYQAQLKFDPPQDVNRSARRDHLLIVMEKLDQDAHMREVYFKKEPITPTRDDFIFYQDEESFRKACPTESLLIDAYKNLSFSEPASSGLWGTPELSHASIAPSSAYYGGIDLEHSALNPVYMKPTREIRYSGDPAEVEKLRTAPTIKHLEYFDVIDVVNNNLGGGESRYRWYPKSGALRQISQATYPDGTPYNTRKMIPHY